MEPTLKEKITLYREMLLCGHDLSFSVCDKAWTFRESNSKDPAVMSELLHVSIPDEMPEDGQPLLISSECGLLWIADRQDEDVFVVGPSFSEDVSVNALTQTLDELGFHYGRKRAALAFLETVPVIPITRFFEYGLMMHYCLTGEHITISDLKLPNTGRERGGEEAPGNAHASWAMEQALLKLVEEGNPDYKKLAGRMVGVGNLANLGNGDSIRHYKNLAIVFTALCTRAAIRGGLPPEIAYTLSDMYINGVEASHDLPEIYEVNAAMQEDFVQRVHQIRIRGEQSAQIQICCHYIQTHVTEKLPVAELARVTGYSETHLSKKFKQEMGVSVTDYITEQKLEHAKELLRAGDRSVGEIAERLGFSSQSYFTSQFRKREGITPSEFRMRSGK